MTLPPIVILTGLISIGIAAQWVASKLRLPAIIVLLLTGFVVGRFVEDIATFPEELLVPIVSLSVALILFEGGLSLRFSELKETSAVVVRLVTVGCLITWILSAFAARMVFSDFRLAALAGAIFTVTGPTVIVPLLRHVRPKRTVSAVAKWEGIVIDPIGAILAVLVYESIVANSAQQAMFDIFTTLAITISVSAVIGAAAAYLLTLSLKHHWIPDHLHNPVLLAVVLVGFTVSNLLQPESGFATVTILGVILANQKQVSISHILEFKETLGILLISLLFVLLAARISPADLYSIGWQGLLFLFVMIFLIRPIAVWASSIGTTLNRQERLFLAFLAPRGIVAAAVASVFALELSHAVESDTVSRELIEQSKMLVSLAFFVIVGTVTFYGLAAGPLARHLGLADVNPQGIVFAGADHVVQRIVEVLVKEGLTVLVVDTNYDNVKECRMLGARTCNANVLSEYVMEEVNFSGIGRFIALTSNDQVNSLAAKEFQHVFGRANTFRITPKQERSERLKQSQSLKTTRFVFERDTTYQELEHRLAAGFVVKTTRLTDEFTLKQFREKYLDEAIVLMWKEPNDQWVIAASEQTTSPKVGCMLIALVPGTKSQDKIAKTAKNEAEIKE